MSSRDRKIIELGLHSVCGFMDLAELVHQGLARQWRPQHPRDQIWHQLKYENAKTYRGNWGNELITVSLNDQNCYCWCTEQRANTIGSWIRDSLFNQERQP